MKILVADDEMLARESIIGSLNKLVFSDIFEAKNGIEALEIIKIQKPEIVIADIRMPGLDGIELLTAAKKFSSDIIFIFVSGYDLFEYAQQAVKLGAFNYLLKPIKECEMKECVDLAIKKLAFQNERIEMISSIKMKAKQGHDALVRQFIKELTTQHGLPEEYIIEKSEALSIRFSPNNYRVIIISMDEYLSMADQLPHNEIELIMFCFENISSEILANYTISAYPFDHGSDLGMIVNYDPNAINAKKLYEIYCEIKDSINRFICPSVTVGIGSSVAEIQNLYRSLHAAQKAVSQRLNKGYNQVFYFEEANNPNGTSIVIDFTIEQKIMICFEKCDMDSLIKIVNDLYSPIKSTDVINMDNLMKLNLQLILLMFKLLVQMKLKPEDILGDEFMLYNEVNSYNNIDIMIRWFIEKFKTCFNAITSQREKSGRNFLSLAKEYIHSNIGSDITLESVAEYVHLSPNYFSKLFKQEANENFVDYVIHVKINKAKLLLKEGNYKANEVSRIVGFNDTKHFYKVFKKITGFTPTEYKDIK